MQTEGLFNLIQSMSKAEKRFFRRFAEMTGGAQCTRYLLLFGAMEQLHEDEPEELAAALDDDAVRQNLPVYRNRLQSLILRSLRTLYAGRSAASEIRQLLEEIEILYERRLFAQCGKRVEKALDLAESHQQEALLLDIQAWRRKLSGQVPLPQQDAQLTAIRTGEVAALARLTQEREFAHIHERQRVRARLRLGSRGNEERPIALPSQLPDDTNFLARAHYHSILAGSALSNNMVAEAGKTYALLMSLWDADPMRIIDHPDFYLATFNNYLGTLFLDDSKHDQFLTAVQRLRKLPDLPRHTRVNFQWLGYHQELMFSMNFVGYQPTQNLIQEIEAWMQSNAAEIHVPRLLAFYFNMTIFYFIYGEYSRANRMLGRILNQPGKAERRDIRNFARIFQVLLQFELQNIDLNEYLVRSAYRYLNRKDELYEFERAIFTLVRKCGTLPNEAARQPAYAEFQEALTAMQQRKATSVGHSELMLWVQAKRQGIPLRALVEKQLAEFKRDTER
jgi:hypothetical protein